MNKLAGILVLAFSVLSGISVADAASCAIKEWPSKAVKDYVENVDGIVKKALETNAKTQCNTNAEGNRNGISDVEGARSSIVGSVNRAVTSENVVTSFRYTVDLVTRSELPPGIRRDHALLDRKQKAIISSIDAVYANCGSEEVFTENASKFGSSTKGRKVGDVLKSVLENHTDVMKLYRESVLGDPGTVVTVDYAPDTFIPEVMKDYGPESMAECNVSGGEGSFFEKVKKSVDRIGNLGEVMQNGTKDWQDAFALLNDPNSKKSRQRESDLLRREISRQGMTTTSASRALANLDAYNGGKGWQGVNGTALAIGETINKGVAAVQGLYEQAKGVSEQYSLGNGKGQPSPQDSKNTDEYLERVENLSTLQTDLGAEIAEDYELARSMISEENSSGDDTFGKLVEAHVELTTTMKEFAPFCETSRKACMEQAANMGGECGECNK